MPRSRSVPTCFVVSPYRPVVSSDSVGPHPDSHEVLGYIEQVLEAEGFDCLRADLSEHGGFVESSMIERLLIADLVIADVTIANPDMMYVIGVREGVGNRPTIFIRAGGGGKTAPTGPGAWDVVPYTTEEVGSIKSEDGANFAGALARHLRQTIDRDLTPTIPLLDATGWGMGTRLDHDKTDVFLKRTTDTTEVGKRIRAALRLTDSAASIRALQHLEDELLAESLNTPDLDTALLGVYIGYRERSAYQHMVDLYQRIPPELRSTPVAREQLALALNRLAEAEEDDPGGMSPHELRVSALATLDALDSRVVSAETLAIRGRIYKGWFRAAVSEGDTDKAQEMLDTAIETYEQAFRVDMRDYFPGINSITLRLTRGTPEDMAVVARLVPIVRMAIEYAPTPESEQERYWQIATKLELACGSRDWDVAAGYVESAMQLDVDDWMHETTIDNLSMYRTMFSGDSAAVIHIDNVIERLRS